MVRMTVVGLICQVMQVVALASSDSSKPRLHKRPMTVSVRTNKFGLWVRTLKGMHIICGDGLEKAEQSEGRQAGRFGGTTAVRVEEGFAVGGLPMLR